MSWSVLIVFDQLYLVIDFVLSYWIATLVLLLILSLTALIGMERRMCTFEPLGIKTVKWVEAHANSWTEIWQFYRMICNHIGLQLYNHETNTWQPSFNTFYTLGPGIMLPWMLLGLKTSECSWLHYVRKLNSCSFSPKFIVWFSYCSFSGVYFLVILAIRKKVYSSYLILIICRQSHKSFFEKSDLFFVCMMQPLSFDIQKHDQEIEAAQVIFG